MRQGYLVLGAILSGIIASAIIFALVPKAAPVPPGPTCLIGEMVAVCPIWTMNGDGGVTILAEMDHTKVRFSVSIVGACNKEPETVVKLKTCRFIQDLVGKRIMVAGRVVNRSDGGYSTDYFVATLLREI